MTDIRHYRAGEQGCYWVKYLGGFIGDTPLGEPCLRLVRFDELGKHHYLKPRRPWDDDAPTLQEAMFDHHRDDIATAEANLAARKERLRAEPPAAPKPPPMDPATRRFLESG